MAKRGIPDFQRQRARQLRREPTLAESRLWLGLRQLRRLGIAHFRRQAPIGPHVVGFVDLQRRIVVEADGRHAGAGDAGRDAWLAGEGFLVLRFRNDEVLANLDGILARIVDAVRAAAPPTPIPSPRGGGEPVRLSRRNSLPGPAVAVVRAADLSGPSRPGREDPHLSARRDSLPLGGRVRVGGAAGAAVPDGDEA